MRKWKKALSLLMALCLMLTFAPAAFAVDSPDTIVGPNGQTYEIPDLALAISDDASANAGIATASVTYGGSGTASDPYTVDSAEALYALATEEFNKTTVTYSYVNITGDIDFSTLTATISEWNGYFKYFYGEIRGVSSDGIAPVIKGLPSNRFLIYGWCGGTIENLTIDPDGNAGILTFIPCKLNGSYGSFAVKNVTVSSDVAIDLSEGDNQANYSPLIYAGAGTFSMTDCVIDANVKITGTTYGSLFHGYYPMDPTGSYTFTNCVNKGTLTMQIGRAHV